jgi:hypothetical protein
MDENVVEFRKVRDDDDGPKPTVEVEADVIEFRKAAPATPVAPVAPTEGEPLCVQCWTLNTIEAAVTSAVAAEVDPGEILDRVFTVLDELGCLPPPPVAGRGA